jgi:hypothetical protein
LTSQVPSRQPQVLHCPDTASAPISDKSRRFMNNHIFPRDLDSFLLNKLPRRENVRETDSAQQLCTNPVAHHVYDLGCILCGIDVHTERPFAERSIHNLHDCFPDRGDIMKGFASIVPPDADSAKFLYGPSSYSATR